MPDWGDNVDWDSGQHWSVPAPLQNTIRMANIATNTSGLPIAGKLAKGQDIITKSTNNPDVPGNATVLAEFVTAQDAMQTAVDDEIATRTSLPGKMTARKEALVTWITKLNGLASFTQSATGGAAQKIQDAGFGVRGTPTPPQPLVAPSNLTVSTNGSPGNTKVTWDTLLGAATYLVQMSPDPMTPTSWELVATVTRASCEVEGAEPGKESWFRVAGVNAVGQGPWSPVSCREVM